MKFVRQWDLLLIHKDLLSWWKAHQLDIYSHALIKRNGIFTLRFIKNLTQRITHEIQKESGKSKLKLHLRKGSLTAFYRHPHRILRHSDETEQEHC